MLTLYSSHVFEKTLAPCFQNFNIIEQKILILLESFDNIHSRKSLDVFDIIIRCKSNVKDRSSFVSKETNWIFRNSR